MNTGSSARASASHIAIALPTAGTDIEGTRAVLRERVALWAVWASVLSSAFYIANIIAWPLTGPSNMPLLDMLLDRGPMLHLAGSLLFGAVALTAHRGRWSVAMLRALDGGALIGGCAVYSLMGVYLTRMHGAFGPYTASGMYAGLLACANVVTARAIMVPSTATRTFWASTIACVPLVLATAVALGTADAIINIACWCGVSIAIATVGSRVIFGLRTEAARVRRLGQYTLEEKIGAGGMGVVYKASHAMLRRPTAIKLLPPDHAGEANILRFEREVQLTAQLSHPNTVAIYDYGRTPDGLFYYAMEYLNGINLEDLVRRDGALPPGRVIYILKQVCGALTEAHEHGLLHRDIKPANIILTERGGEPDVAKVVDFGLVKTIDSGANALTMSSSIVLAGTPLYMPPEVLTASTSGDPRSDLYALGAVGYFLLTAQPVFEAGTVAEVFVHHMHTEPVPPSDRTSTPIPEDLETVILRCLKKKLDDRPASARALLRELKRCTSVSQWTTDQAAEWWSAFRAAPPQTPGLAQPPGPDAVTLSIDLAERLTEQVSIGR